MVTRAKKTLPIVFPMTRDRSRRAMRAYQRYWGLSLGQADIRYIPTVDQIKSAPTVGAWYRIQKGETWYGVAKRAYGTADLKKGLLTMNKATWNDHIERKTTGWESYQVKGLQATPDYSSTNPHAGKGSGHDYPTAWIPPLTGEEPEDIGYVPGGKVVVIPGSPGEIGPVGPQGPGATDAQVFSQVQKWVSENPDKVKGPKGDPGVGIKGEKGDPGTATAADINKAVISYMDANPGKFRGLKGDPGPKGDPGQATESAIMAAVTDWINKNPDKVKGPKGDPGVGIKGEKGDPGTATAADINKAVISYMNTHPITIPKPPATTTVVQGAKTNMWVLPAILAFLGRD